MSGTTFKSPCNLVFSDHTFCENVGAWICRIEVIFPSNSVTRNMKRPYFLTKESSSGFLRAWSHFILIQIKNLLTASIQFSAELNTSRYWRIQMSLVTRSDFWDRYGFGIETCAQKMALANPSIMDVQLEVTPISSLVSTMIESYLRPDGQITVYSPRCAEKSADLYNAKCLQSAMAVSHKCDRYHQQYADA